MTLKWGQVKGEIKRLYVDEGKALPEVRALLLATHGFEASIRAYKLKFEQWGFKKYCPRRCQPRSSHQEISQAISAASSLLAKAESNTVIERLSRAEEDLQIQASVAREQRIILSNRGSKRKFDERESSEDENTDPLAKLTKLEDSITQMRKMIEQILTSVNVQSNSPTGFASCWKQEPMTLEDALGKTVPIPLELVVSWEIFDDILCSHFRALPGAKKVERHEYAIEDSKSRDSFSRKRSWSSLSQPGRKIDMSMIFKDAGKTSVVCPKCDTISKEKKGTLVECKNPDCRMLFRTEDDEGQVPDTSNFPAAKKRRTTESTTLSLGPPEESEDKPSMFKRVIIRVKPIRGTRPQEHPNSYTYPYSPLTYKEFNPSRTYGSVPMAKSLSSQSAPARLENYIPSKPGTYELPEGLEDPGDFIARVFGQGTDIRSYNVNTDTQHERTGVSMSTETFQPFNSTQRTSNYNDSNLHAGEVNTDRVHTGQVFSCLDSPFQWASQTPPQPHFQLSKRPITYGGVPMQREQGKRSHADHPPSSLPKPTSWTEDFFSPTYQSPYVAASNSLQWQDFEDMTSLKKNVSGAMDFDEGVDLDEFLNVDWTEFEGLTWGMQSFAGAGAGAVVGLGF